jgi:hypothetical protein
VDLFFGVCMTVILLCQSFVLLLLLCLQAIVDFHPDPPAGGHDGGMAGNMGDADDGDYGEAAGEAAVGCRIWVQVC